MHSLSRRALLAILILSSAIVVASLRPAGAEPPCPYSQIRQTSVMSGYGFTCTDATNDLRSKVEAEAEADCFGGSVIIPQLVITDECHAYSSTQVEVTGYLRYRCMYCL